MSVTKRPRDGAGNSIARTVKVYDVDKKELIGTFDSATKAGLFTGVKNRYIASYIRTRSRCHTNGLGKIICFR